MIENGRQGCYNVAASFDDDGVLSVGLINKFNFCGNSFDGV